MGADCWPEWGGGAGGGGWVGEDTTKCSSVDRMIHKRGYRALDQRHTHKKEHNSKSVKCLR